MNRGIKSKALNEIKPVENINEIPQRFQETIHVEKEVPSLHNYRTMFKSNRN